MELDIKQDVEQECLSAFILGDHYKALHFLPWLQQPKAFFTFTVKYRTFWQVKPCYNVSLLHLAAYYGWSDIINSHKFCLSVLVNNSKDSSGQTPLHYAAAGSSLTVIKYLISEQFCDPTISAHNGWTSLHYAAIGGDMDVIHYLITEQDCDPKTPSSDGSLPLHIACLAGHLSVSQYFINEQDCDPKTQTMDGVTSLHYASQGGAINMVKYLTTVGCDPAFPDRNGRLPLHIACLNGHLTVVGYFITEQNFSAEFQDRKGCTPLHYASQGGHVSLVRYLITEFGCNPKSKTNAGTLPLHFACLRGKLSVLQYFITEQNCDPESQNEINRATPLHYASEGGHLNIVKYLITAMGCDPSIPDSKGCLPLHFACRQGHMDVIKFLLNEQNHNQRSENGSTPLHYAVIGGHLSIIQYLIKEGGCDPLIVNNNGDTVLHKASCHGHVDVVKWLLHDGQINIMNKDNSGYTCIDVAGQSDNGYELRNLFQTLVKSKRRFPIQSFGKVVLTGNSAAGKTTLAKVITKRAPTKYFNWVKFGNVVQVDTRTSGITMSHIDSKEIGKIVVYDLAGHAEYHSSHSAVMEIVMQQSPATFIHVIDLNNTEEEITQQLHYWLNFIDSTTSATTDDESCIIVVGSHADLLTREQLQRQSSLVDSLIQRKVIRQKYKGMVAMDCRKINTRHTNRLITLLYESHKEIATGTPSISYYCHLLYSFLLHDKKRKQLMTPAVTLQLLMSLLNDAPEGSLIPLQMDLICELLQTLNDRGLIIFLKNQQQRGMSWIVIDTKILLEDINGVLFAPEEFKGSHDRRVANSFGIVLSSTLKQLFPQHDLEMFVGFLEILEVCHCVNLSSVTTNLLCNQALPPVEDRILFFPSLLNTQRPSVTSSNEEFSFGWCLKVRKTEDQFFNSRFLHVLLLRLAYTFPLKNKSTTAIFDHERTCTIWIKGISWDNEDGIKTVVELIDQMRCIVVVMSRKSGTRPVEYSKHRSAVIRLILDLHQQLCSNIDTEEYLISHSLLTADIVTTPSTRHLYPIENVAKSILLHKPYILSCTGISSDLCTERIVLLEPYHLLSPFSVCELMDSSKSDEVISLGVLIDVKIRCQLHWLEVQSHPGVIKHVDDMSIFAGRNPIVIAKLTSDDLLKEASQDVQRTFHLSSIGDHNLSVDVDLTNLLTALKPAYDWFNLGLYLGVPYTTLEEIKIEQRERVADCKREMLVAWLRSSEVTTKSHLIKALWNITHTNRWCMPNYTCGHCCSRTAGHTTSSIH